MDDIFKELKEKKISQEYYYPTKLSFKSDSDETSFQANWKLLAELPYKKWHQRVTWIHMKK